MNNDRLIIQNRRLAEYNLDMEPGFVTLKSQLSSSHELIKQLTMEIGVNRNKLGAVFDVLSHTHTQFSVFFDMGRDAPNGFTGCTISTLQDSSFTRSYKLW